MMYKIRQILINTVVLFVSVIISWSCDRQKNKPGYDFMPDMVYSRAYETFTQNSNFHNGMTMRVPPENTVPMGYTPFKFTIDEESRIEAGEKLVNPFFPGEETIAKGKEVYSAFCIQCHGLRAEGDGILYTSGLYPLKPRTLSGATASKLRDGEIFHTITLGFGSMGAHGSQIRPDDRWKIVLYLRQLQQELTRDSISMAAK